MQDDSVISVQNLCIDYATTKGTLRAVQGVNFTLQRGETLGLVGESGSGKSSIAFGIINYLPENARISNSKIDFLGEDIIKRSPGELRGLWSKNITMVYQDPMSSLNPSFTIGFQMAEIFRCYQNVNRNYIRQKIVKILERVNFPDPESSVRKFPHQLSGGQQQRVIIAMALCRNPDLLIMDEPTTGLDVTTEATILDLINKLKTDFNSAILFISHNLGVIAKVSDKIGVLYAGRMLETGMTKEVYGNPLHPYTIALLNCVPNIDSGKMKELSSISGGLPDLTRQYESCIFYPRCPYREERCAETVIPLMRIGKNREAACLRWKEIVHLKEEKKAEVASRELTSKVFEPTVRSERKYLININHLKKYYGFTNTFAKLLGKTGHYTRAIDDVSLSITDGEVLGIVGESGCGKSTLAWITNKLNRPTSGKICYKGKDLWQMSRNEERTFRQECQIVFQNPDSSLNPRKTIEQIIERPLILFKYGTSRQRKLRTAELMEMVQLDAHFAKCFPHELSGGQKQRVGIARAFASNPRLIICDEVLSALDVSVQASILNLLIELQRKLKTTYIFISHDLSVVNYISDSICVLYLGKISEIGRAEEVFSPPFHPYTHALLSAVPRIEADHHEEAIRLEGPVPSAKNPPRGCPFHTRCPEKIGSICERKLPIGNSISETHTICCHLFD